MIILDCEQSAFSPQVFGASGNVIIMQIRCKNEEGFGRGMVQTE